MSGVQEVWRTWWGESVPVLPPPRAHTAHIVPCYQKFRRNEMRRRIGGSRGIFVPCEDDDESSRRMHQEDASSARLRLALEARHADELDRVLGRGKYAPKQ
jgi:hypothetical protein